MTDQPVRIITAPDQVTPAWLSGVLRDSGALTRGEVRSLTLTRVHDKQHHTLSYFYAVEYSPDAPPNAPRRLFLKVPRATAEPPALKGGAREVALYHALGKDHAELPLVRCHSAAVDLETGRYHLLLDDLSDTHEQPRWHLTVGRFVVPTLDSLAAFHAYWAVHPEKAEALVPLPVMTSLSKGDREQAEHRRAALPDFFTAAGDLLSAADRRIYEAVLAALPHLWERRLLLLRQTVRHGDPHFWNLLYPLDREHGRTYVVDWQTYWRGPFAWDLAHFLVLRCPRRTPARDRTLVRRYHEGLLAYGVTGYDWDACWHEYRLLAAEQVVYPLANFADTRRTDFWPMFVPRALRAFRELDCQELLAD